MRKYYILITICLIFFSSLQSVHSEVLLPESFWTSQIILREGIIDVNGLTVGALFRNKEYISTETLDGRIATSRVGAITVVGNTVSIPIEVTLGDEVILRLTFHIQYRGDESIIDSITIDDRSKGKTSEVLDFESKYQVLMMYTQIVESPPEVAPELKKPSEDSGDKRMINQNIPETSSSYPEEKQDQDQDYKTRLMVFGSIGLLQNEMHFSNGDERDGEGIAASIDCVMPLWGPLLLSLNGRYSAFSDSFIINSSGIIRHYPLLDVAAGLGLGMQIGGFFPYANIRGGGFWVRGEDQVGTVLWTGNGIIVSVDAGIHLALDSFSLDMFFLGVRYQFTYGVLLQQSRNNMGNFINHQVSCCAGFRL